MENIDIQSQMVEIPYTDIKMMNTEVTQELFEKVTGINPSYFKGSPRLPVEQVSWFDAVYFCNTLSRLLNLIPFYLVNGTSDETLWNFTPCSDNAFAGLVTVDKDATGFRLPYAREWRTAALGKNHYRYASSNNIDEAAWYWKNSGNGYLEGSSWNYDKLETYNCRTHEVGLLKPNDSGLFDMCGNVWEWCNDNERDYKVILGGSWGSTAESCEVGYSYSDLPVSRYEGIGFRIVCRK